MKIAELTSALKKRALELGFDMAGVCPAVVPQRDLSLFDEWLSRGYAGEMRYLPDRRQAYADPGRVLEGARSIVMLAMHYRTEEPSPAPPGFGRVSRYAWGEGDYHDVIHERLKRLKAWLEQAAPGCRARGVVDSAPVLERAFARLAGLGWVGKNTLLLSPQSGSYFFLAALLTDLELASDAPFEADHCGSCRACLDACPTGAFPAPYLLDATRCISYLTIEQKGAGERELRTQSGDWLFGCDVCQDVCPWNRKAPPSAAREFFPRESMNPLDAADLFNLSEAQLRERFRHTPLARAKRRGILRNAAIVLGNNPGPKSLAALAFGLNDAEPLVRQCCAWALAFQNPRESLPLLHGRKNVESDSQVLEELDWAIETAKRDRDLRPWPAPADIR